MRVCDVDVSERDHLRLLLVDGAEGRSYWAAWDKRGEFPQPSLKFQVAALAFEKDLEAMGGTPDADS